MESLFYGCEYLSSLPDISNWNTNNIKFLSDLFYGYLILPHYLA